jgi:LysR family transcriptional regulator, hydrogen peroxide-inducible genes activator
MGVIDSCTFHNSYHSAMTLTELRYIIAVAREKHFGRASEACFVSQPTLSVAIKKLEDELGVQIFERGSTEVSVTTLGTQIVEQAQRVIEQSNLIKEIAKQGKDPLAGPLRLGVIYTIGPYLLPELVRQVIQDVPQMPLILQENFTVKLLEQLRQGSIDVAILAEPFSDSGLTTWGLYDEPFIVAVPAKHAWAERKSIASSELKNENMLLLGTGHCFRDNVLEVCPEYSRFSAGVHQGEIQKSVEGSSLETIRHMVASGIGVTVLPWLARGADQNNKRLVSLVPFDAPIPKRRVSLVWRKSFTRIQAIKAVRDCVMALASTGALDGLKVHEKAIPND